MVQMMEQLRWERHWDFQDLLLAEVWVGKLVQQWQEKRLEPQK